MAPRTQDYIDSLQAKIRTNAGWCTKHKVMVEHELAVYERACGLMDSVLLTAAMKKLNDKHLTLQGQYEELLQICVDAGDNALFKQHEDKYAKIADTWTSIRAQYSDVLVRTEEARKKNNPAPAPGPAAPAPAPREAKEARGAKPPVLTSENTPDEFRVWINEYEVYHDLSNFALLSVKQQRVYLNRLLSKDINKSLAAAVNDDAAIVGPGGCLEQLRKEFKSYYPLNARRYAAIGCSPNKGETDKQFWIRMWDMYRDADMSAITMEQAFCVMFSTHCPDRELGKEMRKLKAIDRAAYREVMEEFAAEKNTSSQTKEDKAKAAFVKPGKSGNQPKSGGGGKPATGNGPYDSSKTCESCGARGHDKAACKGNLQIICNSCGKKGHYQSVCRSSGEKKSAKAKKTFAAAAANSEDNQGYSSDSSDEEVPAAAVRKATFTKLARGMNVSEISRDTPRMNVSFSTESGNGSFRFDSTPDTGATRTVIAANLLEKSGIKFSHRRKGQIQLEAANGQMMSCPGTVVLHLDYEGQRTRAKAIVCEDMYDEVLISWYDLIGLNVISKTFPHVLDLSRCSDCRAKIKRKGAVKKLKALNEAEKLASRLCSMFPDILKDELSYEPMAGEPMKIHLRDDIEIVPKSVRLPRPMPVHEEPEGRITVEELIKKRVLARVTEPTSWCNPAFFVPKKGGKMRLVTDFTHLNKFIKRPTHPFPSSQEIMKKVKPTSKVFLKLDAVGGYHQMALDEESSYLTTFILKWGRFRYLRGPMGLSPTNDEWCCKSDKAIEG